MFRRHTYAERRAIAAGEAVAHRLGIISRLLKGVKAGRYGAHVIPKHVTAAVIAARAAHRFWIWTCIERGFDPRVD